MKVIWKRPDGFHGASPSDFRVVELDGHSRIWLHKADHEWFPFRISGDWGEEDATKRLNRLVNLLGQDKSSWIKYVHDSFGNSKGENIKVYVHDTSNWISHLKASLKGDTWEIDIMSKALSLIEENLRNVAESAEAVLPSSL